MQRNLVTNIPVYIININIPVSDCSVLCGADLYFHEKVKWKPSYWWLGYMFSMN